MIQEQWAGTIFISPPNVYMSNTWLVPGITGGYYARWCQRAVYKFSVMPAGMKFRFHDFWGIRSENDNRRPPIGK